MRRTGKSRKLLLNRYTPVLERFWLQVDKRGAEDCWLWVGYCSCNGTRPTISVNGKQVKAHRFSYEQFVGPIPKGRYVLHTCDNPKCVNPNHLFTGTQDDNMKDMKEKGRANHPDGDKNGRAKLTIEDVRFIRRHYKFRSKEFGQKQLADRFNVCVLTIQDVLTGKSWSGCT